MWWFSCEKANFKIFRIEKIVFHEIEVHISQALHNFIHKLLQFTQLLQVQLFLLIVFGVHCTLRESISRGYPFFIAKKGHKCIFYSVSSKHLSYYSNINWVAMIKIFSKTYKIRLVGPFCSRDYFHAFPHCIELIIYVTNTFL